MTNEKGRQKLMTWLAVLIGGALLSMFTVGCVSMPTQEELANFDYGSPITIDYKKAIVKYFEPTLFDPYSAMIQFQDGEPQKWWHKDPPILGSHIWIGYAVPVRLNAKNRFGGYTGMKEYRFLFKNNRIIKVLKPEELRLIQPYPGP